MGCSRGLYGGETFPRRQSRVAMTNPHMVLRSYRRDDEVKDRKLAEGTVRRILGYATP